MDPRTLGFRYEYANIQRSTCPRFFLETFLLLKEVILEVKDRCIQKLVFT